MEVFIPESYTLWEKNLSEHSAICGWRGEPKNFLELLKLKQQNPDLSAVYDLWFNYKTNCLSSVDQPEASLIVPDFTLFVWRSSWNCVFFILILATLLLSFYIDWCPQSRIGSYRRRKKRRKNKTKKGIITWTAVRRNGKIRDYVERENIWLNIQ